jgi:hypothetical protein
MVYQKKFFYIQTEKVDASYQTVFLGVSFFLALTHNFRFVYYSQQQQQKIDIIIKI